MPPPPGPGQVTSTLKRSTIRRQSYLDRHRAGSLRKRQRPGPGSVRHCDSLARSDAPGEQLARPAAVLRLLRRDVHRHGRVAARLQAAVDDQGELAANKGGDLDVSRRPAAVADPERRAGARVGGIKPFDDPGCRLGGTGHREADHEVSDHDALVRLGQDEAQRQAVRPNAFPVAEHRPRYDGGCGRSKQGYKSQDRESQARPQESPAHAASLRRRAQRRNGGN